MPYHATNRDDLGDTGNCKEARTHHPVGEGPNLAGQHGLVGAAQTHQQNLAHQRGHRREKRLDAGGAAVDLNTDYQIGAPEVQVTPDRLEASKIGVSMSDLATTMNSLIGGSSIGKFETGGRRIDIRARLLSSQRSRAEDIGTLRVRSDQGTLIPFPGDLAASELIKRIFTSRRHET